MPQTPQCPRCRTELAPTEESAGELHCPQCQGMFVPSDEVRDEILQDAAHFEALSSETRDPEVTATSIECPVCSQPMRELQLAGFVLDRCQSCGGTWLDTAEQLAPDDSPASAARYLLYSLSLPERALRSTIGLAGGTAQRAAEFLVPQAFQSSKTYEIVVRNSLKFLTDDIGGATPADDDEPAVEGFMARKAVGNFVDFAGLATLHVSPLWMLAIVSDVAYGTKTYVLELAEELKKQGIIDDTSTIHHVDDVLEAIQNATGQSATLFDTPPLSVDQLRETLQQTREAATSADYASVLPQAEVQRYWNEMRDIATAEDVSLLGVSAAMTMHTLEKAKSTSTGALTGLRVAGGLLNRHVLGHYVDSLTELHDKGFYETVRQSYAPYVEAVWNNFSSDKSTWTEEVVTGRAFGTAWNAVRGWFGSRSADEKNG